MDVPILERSHRLRGLPLSDQGLMIGKDDEVNVPNTAPAVTRESYGLRAGLTSLTFSELEGLRLQLVARLNAPKLRVNRAGRDRGNHGAPLRAYGRSLSEPEPVTITSRVTGPVKAALAIFERWRIDEQQAATILGSEDPLLVTRLRTGAQLLRSRDAQDRARMLIDIYEGVFALFENAKAEQGWIRAPQPNFSGQSILGTMAEGSFLSLLRVKRFIDHVNGR
jgi:hypothetical protein